MSTTMPLSEAKRLLLERRLRGEGAAPRAEADTVRPRPPGAPVPVSPEQGQIWLHASVAQTVPLYNEPITIHRHGPFSLDAMQRSFDELLRRHEAWRTSFEVVDGEVRQIVHPDLRIVLPLVDLSDLPREAAEEEALRLAAADARVPISMADAPLIRAKVVRLAPEEHRLYLTLHHIIFDGVSLYRVVMPELAILYEAFAAGRTPALPPPVLQYGDYAIWRRRESAQAEFAQQMKHWRRELAGELPTLLLPFDRPRPPAVTHRGAIERFDFPPGLTEALHALSRSEGVTLYMVLLAAFKALLHRYTGQEDIIIGGVTDARRRPELERLIGYFLNPISLRTRPSASLPFRGLLAQARDAALGALGNSDVPFDQVVRELHIRRDPAAHPIFTVFFTIQPPVDLVDPAWDLTQMDVGGGGAKFDIYFELEERPSGVIARFIYNTALFDAATMQRMAGHYLTLLAGVVADPGRSLGTLPLLTEPELHLVRDAWNRTARPTPRTTLHGVVEEQVRRAPNAPAVVFEGRAWTYAELDERAERIAERLRRAGAGPGGLVGLCVERSAEMVASVLAILKAGAAYLPLDPALPSTRLEFIIGDAAPVLVITQRSLAHVVPAGAPVLLLDDVTPDAVEPDVPPAAARAAGPDDLAYVLYTSGTTGRPKGVEVPHRAVVNVVAQLADELEVWAGDALLAVTTLSFDIATLELFMPLAAGARLVVASREVAADPVLLAELIGQSGCTVMQATPSTWRGLIESGWTCPTGLKALCGGESLPRGLADALLAAGARLWNLYGPTEATIWATAQPVTRGGGPVPIGRPIGNLTALILDASGNHMPVGVAGELYIGGTGVARGYRNRADLTRERFITRDGARLYRTGDNARWRPDGTIEFLGRRDQQVKVRGFRIELEEVEGAIAAHPRVAAAAARAAPDPSGENSLTGYIVVRNSPASDPAPDTAELRAFLRERLPDYMIPTAFVTLVALPLSGTGKIDRNALPAPAPRAAPAWSDEPRDEWERRVARVWEEVLGVGQIGWRDDFFDLGGHSILFAKLQQRIKAEFQQTLPLAKLFQAHTVARMARLLYEGDGGQSGDRGGERAGQTSQLMQVQPGGSRARLYWVEPSPSIRRVANELGREQPVLGLSLNDADVEALGKTPTFEAVASRLVRTLLDAQPVGPYRLGGFCMMGVLAFEMAVQLRAAGHAVAMVIIVDGMNPAFYRRVGSLAMELSKLRFHLATLQRLSSRERLRYLFGRTRTFLKRIVPLRSEPQQWTHPLDAMLYRGLLHYRPETYGGDVTVLQAAERADQVDVVPGWTGVVTGALISRDVPGTHETLLDARNIGGLGAGIHEALERAARSA